MKRWQIGDVTITRIVELETSTIGRFVLPQATADVVREIDWVVPDYLDTNGELLFSMHALVIEAGDRRILVDTCLGNDKERTYREWNRLQSSFLEDLGEAGFPPDSIDTVLCTHLHVDHVGWNTRWVDGSWVPTFPGARYLFAKTEWEYWKQEPEEFGPVITDSVRPIVDAGLADLIETDFSVSDEVQLVPTPGHTPGHVSVSVRSRGEEAVITGDLIHHPCQLARPDWSSAVDWDPDLCAKTRREFLERYADRPVLVIGTHFAGPTAGRVVRDGAVFRLDA